MIISDTKKFIFIHNPKAGGTSVRDVLHPYATVSVWEHKVNKQLPVGENKLLSKHATAQRIANYVGAAKWHEYYTFAFVRNPWDLIVSQYLYAKRYKDAAKHNLASGTFTDFVMWYATKEAARCSQPLRLFSQLHYIGGKNNVLVKFVGRFERISTDFETVCKTLKLDHSLPHLNKTKHGHYREFYNSSTKNIVHKLYTNDIETFGYTF